MLFSFYWVTADLLALLKWRDNKQTIEEILSKFMSLEGEEVVKVRSVFAHLHILCAQVITDILESSNTS